MLSLLSPAKKLNFDKLTRNCESTKPMFGENAFELAKIAATLDTASVGQLMKISPKLADLNSKRFQSFSLEPNKEQVKQAVFAFAGDTYVGLNAIDIDPKLDSFLQGSIRILSGMYGILRPFDLIQPYRLEMGSKLKNPIGNSLYQFWGNRILQSLEVELQNHEFRVLINLASDEYFKVIGAHTSNVNVITPKFYEKKSGEYKLVSFYAKKARGLMARYIVNNEITKPEDIKSFNLEGYIFEGHGSNRNIYVFSR